MTTTPATTEAPSVTATLSERTGLDEVLRFVARNPHPVVRQLADTAAVDVVLFSASPLLREHQSAN